MAEITNPQVVKFANERGRPLADVAEQLYQSCKRYQQEWATVTVPNTADLVADGSEVDGRKRISGAHVTNLKALADSMVTWFETGTPSRIVQLQLVSVNGQARF